MEKILGNTSSGGVYYPRRPPECLSVLVTSDFQCFPLGCVISAQADLNDLNLPIPQAKASQQNNFYSGEKKKKNTTQPSGNSLQFKSAARF